VSKLTNSKHPAKKTAGRQITNKSQMPSLKFQTRAKTIFFIILFVICFFGHWNLFVICILLFGISPFGHCHLFDI